MSGRYDRKHTLFYLDPPFRTVTPKHYHSYSTDDDFIQLNKTLKNIRGKLFLSINNDNFIRLVIFIKRMVYRNETLNLIDKILDIRCYTTNKKNTVLKYYIQ